MKKLYELAFLARVGVVVMVALIFWGFVACLLPAFRAPNIDAQLYAIRHADLRNQNELYTNLLLESIKANDGYLVLGTSETNSLPRGNYFDFLNADSLLPCGFSVLAGAGRTASTYFPLIQGNDHVKNLKVIYFINPAYWCNKVAYHSADYFHRYLSYTAYRKANRPLDAAVDHILRVNYKQASWFDRIVDPLAYYADKMCRKYDQDLLFTLFPSKFDHTLVLLDRKQHKQWDGHALDSAHHNYQYNVALDFDLRSYSLTAHPEATYRYDELRTMIRLCKERHVDIVFVVGPYNHQAFANFNPGQVVPMRTVCENVLKLLEDEQAAYIDATDISTLPATFDDWQHHSSHGGYLIYQKIKSYVLEKENR